MSDPTSEALAAARVVVPKGSRLRITARAPDGQRHVRGQDACVSIVGPDGHEVPITDFSIVAVAWEVDARQSHAKAAIVFDGVEIEAEGEFDPGESRVLLHQHLRRRAEIAEEENRRLREQLDERGPRP